MFPLGDFVDDPAIVMTAPPETTALCDAFRASDDRAEGRAVTVAEIEPADFVERPRKARAVIVSGERRLYGNILLRKGVLRP